MENLAKKRFEKISKKSHFWENSAKVLDGIVDTYNRGRK